jgi:hypothetical protein
MSETLKNGGIEGWYVVSQMGHKTMIGDVRQVQMGEAVLLRVDIPEYTSVSGYYNIEGKYVQEARTFAGRAEFISPASIYSLTPISKEAAMKLLATGRMSEPTWLEPTRIEAAPAKATLALPAADEDEYEDDEMGFPVLRGPRNEDR